MRRHRGRSGLAERLSWLRDRERRSVRLGSYGAGDYTSTRADWISSQLSPDDTLIDIDVIRARSRDLVRNSALAAGLVQTYVDSTVGPGLACVPSPRADVLGVDEAWVDRFRREAEDAWASWGRVADVTERTDWMGVQRSIERACIEGGDVLVHYVMRDMRSSPWRFGVELVEAERIRSQVSDADWSMGVLLGRGGQHIAYMVWPGFTSFAGEPAVVRKWDREGQVAELYAHVTRPGQTRGLPLLTPILPLFRDLDDYLEAEIVAAVQSACITSVVKTSNTAAAASGRTSETTEDGYRIEEFRPGQVEYLAPGEEIQGYNPQRPGNTFDPFVLRLTRVICRGIGLPYELGALDFSQTNYSSARAALLEVRRLFAARQSHFSSRICQQVYWGVMHEAFAQGRLSVTAQQWRDYASELCRADWVAPGAGWIDPRAEVEASIAAINAGLTTRELEVRRASGRSWRNHMLPEIKRERSDALALGMGGENGGPASA